MLWLMTPNFTLPPVSHPEIHRLGCPGFWSFLGRYIHTDNVNRRTLFNGIIMMDNRLGNRPGHNYVHLTANTKVVQIIFDSGRVWVFVMSLWLSKWTFEVDWQISQLMECGESLIQNSLVLGPLPVIHCCMQKQSFIIIITHRNISHFSALETRAWGQ